MLANNAGLTRLRLDVEGRRGQRGARAVRRGPGCCLGVEPQADRRSGSGRARAPHVGRTASAREAHGRAVHMDQCTGGDFRAARFHITAALPTTPASPVHWSMRTPPTAARLSRHCRSTAVRLSPPARAMRPAYVSIEHALAGRLRDAGTIAKIRPIQMVFDL